ncbi:MAG: caspase family protein, partial [Microcystaceae cyanobacterium]
MDTYRCIAIGINRYQFLQPLNYAEADAQALHQFLRDEGNLSPKQSLLLSDTSAWVDKQSTYPNRDNILNWLGIEETQKDEGETNSEFPTPFAEQVAWRHSEFPTLWFYFSGYGVNYQGDDYLMPIDGQLEDIPNTGIAIRSLLQALQAQNAHKILVILDINRSLMEETTVGQQTIALGKKMGIAVILSAQTDECSYEATSLGHGLFTAALLEALRYYHCHLTLAKLDRYLRDRLPELSTHYWRPIQTPAIVSPSLEASYQPLLPSPQTTRLKWEGFLPRTEKEVSCTTVQSASQGTAIREKTLDQKNSEFRIPNSELRIQVPDFSRGDQENKASLFQVPGFIREANPKSIDKQVLSSQSKSSVSVFPKILRSKWFWIGGGVTLLLASIMTQLLDLGISFDAFNPSKSDVEQAVLSRSKIYLQSHQASRFKQSIGVARK